MATIVLAALFYVGLTHKSYNTRERARDPAAREAAA
jgi:hypothetical protein